MPLVSKSIPNLINGISQQPSALRLASQAESVINCMPSSVEGLKKRPPFYHQSRMFTGTAGTTRPFSHIVDRDGTVQYMVYITDGDIKVFSLAGVPQTVTYQHYDSNGAEVSSGGTSCQSYLDIVNTSEPANTFRLASIADNTFITNRETVVEMESTVSPSYTQATGLVFIRQADYNVTYSVTLNATDHAETKEEFTTPIIGSGASTTAPSNKSVCDGLRDLINNDSVLGSEYTATTIEDYLLKIVKDDGGDFTIKVSDTLADMFIVGIKGEVEAIQQLPVKGLNGQLIKVVGSSSTAADDYYVKFETTDGTASGKGVWRETVAPGIEYKLKATKMPHVLIRNANGTFTFKRQTWGNRIAGDATSAKNPPFVGEAIKNLNVFRNRLVMLADEYACLSAADDYTRFWPETVQTVVDSDPIYISTGGTDINFLTSSMAFSNTLLLFSRGGQFRLDTGASGIGAPLTPATATITAMTKYDSNDLVDPIGVGRTVFFPINKGQYSGLREFYIADVTGSTPLSTEVTASVPRYIPKNLVSIAASVSEETIIMISKDEPTRLYIYKFLFQDDTKLQSAWSYWEVKGAKSILSASILDSDLYIIAEYADGVYLEKASLRPESIDELTEIEVLLDRKTTEANCTFSVSNQGGLNAQTVITLPYPLANTGVTKVVGRPLLVGGTNYADINSFPTSQPATNAVITIVNAQGLIVSSTGTATNAKTTGNAAISISEMPGYLRGKTIQANEAISFIKQAASNTYKFRGLVRLKHGQVLTPTAETVGNSSTNGTITVDGDLSTSVFYVGEPYDMTYEFSTPYLKAQDESGTISVSPSPYLQLRKWAVVFDKTSSFEIKVTPAGRPTSTYPYNGIQVGQNLIGKIGIPKESFRVPVMTRNIDAKIVLFSSSPLPCKFQSAEWEGWLQERTRRI
tara:strand:+ start:621 stop:3377 length:2757 start_codon:yes stop_codon:yes gene_type:complete